DERARLFEAGAKFRSDDVVVLGAGNAFTKAEAITHAHSAEKVGLDGLLLTIPPYIVPNRHEIVSFYQSVSDASEILLTAYSGPHRCVVDMTVHLLDELADIDHVVAIKNSTGDFASFLEGTYKLASKVRYFGLPTSELGADLALLGHRDGLMGSGGVL